MKHFAFSVLVLVLSALGLGQVAARFDSRLTDSVQLAGGEGSGGGNMKGGRS